MITLDQIRSLDSKVKNAIDEILDLRKENTELKLKLSSYEDRIDELDGMIGQFKAEQGQIEEGIIRTLKVLDTFESNGEQSPDSSEEDAADNSDAPSSEMISGSTDSDSSETEETGEPESQASLFSGDDEEPEAGAESVADDGNESDEESSELDSENEKPIDDTDMSESDSTDHYELETSVEEEDEETPETPPPGDLEIF